MNRKSLQTLTLGASIGLAFLGSPGIARAFFYVESGDAGQTLATAAGPSPSFSGQSLTFISGSIDPSTGGGTVYDADLYKIFITNTSTFSATTTGGGSTLDTSLFLFDLSGRAVIANDDASGTTLQSTLPAGNATLSALGPGTYYLGISLSGSEAINSVSQLLFNQGLSTDIRTAAPGLNPTTLSTFNNGVSFDENGGYVISLTSASAVPEPSTWTLMGAGALALGVTLSHRNRMARVAAV